MINSGTSQGLLTVVGLCTLSDFNLEKLLSPVQPVASRPPLLAG